MVTWCVVIIQIRAMFGLPSQAEFEETAQLRRNEIDARKASLQRKVTDTTNGIADHGYNRALLDKLSALEQAQGV